MKNRTAGSPVRGVAATALALSLAVGVGLAGQALAQGVSFAGKTVTLLHNTSAGSSVDVFARQVGPYVVKHLPGKPDFIVVSKPGGRFLLGASHLYRNVKPDGMTLGMMATLPGQMAAGNKMPMDISEFVQVGGQGQTYIYYVHKDLGMTSADQLRDPPGQIISGTGAPNTNSQLMWRLFMKSIGAKNYRQIYGYRGQLGQLKALRSGEINMASMLGTLYLQMLPGLRKEGLTLTVFETGNIDRDDNVYPTRGLGVPTIEQLWRKFAPETVDSKEFRAYKLLMSSIQLTWQYVLPPETPAAYAAAWDKAMASALADVGFVAEMKKAGSTIPFWVDAATTARKLAEIKTATQDPEYKAAIKSVYVRR